MSAAVSAQPLLLTPLIDGDVRGLISTFRGHFMVEAGQY
jgi:hypothetical protein